jgi:Tfp pilus assembly protein PilN
MTVRINFLPKSYQPPKQVGAKEIGIVVAAAVALLGTGGYYTSVYAGTVTTANQTKADEMKLKQVQTRLALAEQISGRETRVTQAETDLKSLAGRHWSGVMITLSQLTPQHVSWTALKTSGNDITLKGTSRGMIDMAQLLGGLVTESTVDQIALKFINEKGIPVSVVVKQGDKVDGKNNVPDQLKEMGTVRNLEFELVITLVPAEGRQLPHGA